MLVSVASFLPIIIVGPISDLVGTTTVLITVAIAVFLSGVASFVRRGPLLRDQVARPPIRTPSTRSRRRSAPTGGPGTIPRCRRNATWRRPGRDRAGGCDDRSRRRRRRAARSTAGRPDRPGLSRCRSTCSITGRIATLAGRSGFGWVEAIGIRDGRIAFAGSEVELETRADPFTRADRARAGRGRDPRA